MTEHFLIGMGRDMTATFPLPAPAGPPDGRWSPDKARLRFAGRLRELSRHLDSLPDELCPEDRVVLGVVLQPDCLAGAWYPGDFFRLAGFVHVGSRDWPVRRERRGQERAWELHWRGTVLIYCAARREDLRALPDLLMALPPDSVCLRQLARVEDVWQAPCDIEGPAGTGAGGGADSGGGDAGAADMWHEAVLHLVPGRDSAFIRKAFKRYARGLGFSFCADSFTTGRFTAGSFTKGRFTADSPGAGSVWFAGLRGPADRLAELGRFAFVRRIGPMPGLGLAGDHAWSLNIDMSCSLPGVPPLSASRAIAVLDGGLPRVHSARPWLGRLADMEGACLPDADSGPGDCPEEEEWCGRHGLAMASAALFGRLPHRRPALRPYAPIDMYRVTGPAAACGDGGALYRALGNVLEVLRSGRHEFAVLGAAPEGQLHGSALSAWQAVLDDALCGGSILLASPAGNGRTGDRDGTEPEPGRIHASMALANALVVGSANRPVSDWKAAGFSRKGPGRLPGPVKPDLVAFGGSLECVLPVLAPGARSMLAAAIGTGFAAACALRQAAGIRAVMGHAISTLAVKALLVHGAAGSGTNGSGAAGSETAGPEKRLREDWGRIPEDLTALIASPDGTAAMVLQGELEAGLGLLAPLPLPAGGIRGNCRLRATLCCAWPARTADRRELAQPELHAVLTLDGEVPHEELAGRSGSDEAGLNRACRTDRTARTGRTDKTARLDRLGPELFFDWPLRPCEDGPGCRPVRWTNTLRGEGNFSGTSLRRPAFALWQRPADEDRDAGRVSPLPFALVLTMEAAEHPHLFEEILEAHGRLAHLVPRTVMLFEPETLGEDD